MIEFSQDTYGFFPPWIKQEIDYFKIESKRHLTVLVCAVQRELHYGNPAVMSSYSRWAP